MGRIVSIVHTPEGIDPRPPDHYARVPLGAATLEPGRGIVTDRKGGRPERQLNLMALETLEQLRAEGYRTAPGEMGEQLTLSGVDVDQRNVGSNPSGGGGSTTGAGQAAAPVRNSIETRAIVLDLVAVTCSRLAHWDAAGLRRGGR